MFYLPQKLLAKTPASQLLTRAYYTRRMLIRSYKIIPIGDALRYIIHEEQWNRESEIRICLKQKAWSVILSALTACVFYNKLFCAVLAG